jgi:hypothetical protein
MARVVLPKHSDLIDNLLMSESSLFLASADARDDGHIKMAECLAKMYAAVRTMLNDLGCK